MQYFKCSNHEYNLNGASNSVTVSHKTTFSSVFNVIHIPSSFLIDTTLFQTTKHCSVFALQHISGICCSHHHRALLLLKHRLTWCWSWSSSESRSECFDMWCRRRMEKIRWTDRVTNEVLQRVKDERNMLQTICCQQ